MSEKKNNFKFNVINLVLTLSILPSIAYCILELKEDFSLLIFIVTMYSLIHQIFMYIVIYASFRQRNLPEFLEFLENTNIQLVSLILINLLLIDTSLIGLIIGCIEIIASISLLVYLLKQ